MALVISADELKKTIPGYDPEQSHLVHTQSAKLADQKYDECIKTCKYEEVILLSGGAASGKTEFMSEYLLDGSYLVVDGTLPTFEGAKIKTRKARKHSKKVKIVAVWPADLKFAFAAFLQRDRKFPDQHFYRTHSQSRNALLEIACSSLEVDIELYENHYDDEGLVFYQYTFDSRDRLIEHITKNQYTEKAIIELLTGS